MKNIFDKSVTEEVIGRIEQLSHDSKPQWGKMSVGQMLAHCNVTYVMIYKDSIKRPNAFARFMLKTFVKPIVVGPKPYKRNSRTAPAFLITDPRDFEKEKGKLIDNIRKTQELGPAHFDNKESHSFGKLTVEEWNNMFYKHLDHHLAQFGV